MFPIVDARTNITIERSLFSNNYHYSNGENTETISLSYVNYYNGTHFTPINRTIVPSDDENYDWMVSQGVYEAYFKEDPKASPAIKFWYNTTKKNEVPPKSGFVTFDPQGIYYRQSEPWFDEELIKTTRSVVGVPQGNNFTYEDVFGDGLNLLYRYGSSTLSKSLVIETNTTLPKPSEWFVGDVTLDIDFVFQFSDSVECYLDDVLWNKKTTTSGSQIDFKYENKTIFFFPTPLALETPHIEEITEGNETMEIDVHRETRLKYEVKKSGKHFYISVKTPYNWLSSNLTYPIVIDPSLETLIPEGDGTYTEWFPYPSGASSGTDYLMVDGNLTQMTDWTKGGNQPYLNDTEGTNKIYTKTNLAKEGNFTFADTIRNSSYSLDTIEVELYAYQEGTLETVTIFISNGSAWHDIGTATPDATYGWKGYGDAWEWITTWEGVDNAVVYVEYKKTGSAGLVHVDAMRLKIGWTKLVGKRHYNKVDDPVGNPDDGSTYVRTSEGIGGDGNYIDDTYTIPNSTISDENTISNFTVFVRGQAWQPMSGSMPVYMTMVRTYGTNYLGDSYTAEKWVSHTYNWTNNPNTGNAWTTGEINATEIGVRGKSGYAHVFGYWFPACVTQIYVNVTYSASSSPSDEEVDCDWIGTNTTIAGATTLFSADFTDLNQSNGISHNLFSSNITGSWLNSSWSALWFRGNWTEWTDTLNNTVGVVVAFRFYVNDSSGGEHESTICFFTSVAETREVFPKFRAGAGTPIPYIVYFVNVLRGALTTMEGNIIIVVFGGVGFLLGMLMFRRSKERTRYKVKRVETN